MSQNCRRRTSGGRFECYGERSHRSIKFQRSKVNDSDLPGSLVSRSTKILNFSTNFSKAKYRYIPVHCLSSASIESTYLPLTVFCSIQTFPHLRILFGWGVGGASQRALFCKGAPFLSPLSLSPFAMLPIFCGPDSTPRLDWCTPLW